MNPSLSSPTSISRLAIKCTQCGPRPLVWSSTMCRFSVVTVVPEGAVVHLGSFQVPLK